MESLKIFQLEKNSDDIRKTVLTNIIKMLTERKLMENDKMTQNIKKITKTHSDENMYAVDIQNYRDGDDKSMIIKLFLQRITSISKQSIITEFLNKYKNVAKLIVVKAINTKAGQYIISHYPKTELFLESDLMINLTDNVLVPRYEILDRNSEQYNNFRDSFNCKKRNIPKLLKSDPMARYYNLKKDDIVRVIYPSETTAYTGFYRIVV